MIAFNKTSDKNKIEMVSEFKQVLEKDKIEAQIKKLQELLKRFD